MKQYKKVLIIVASVMMALGIILCGTALLSTGFDISKFSSENFVTEQKAEDIAISGSEKIVLKVSTEEVKVSVSPDNLVHINFFDTEEGRYDLSKTDTKLSFVRKTEKIAWYKRFSFDFGFESDPIELQIPQNHVGDIQIETSTGSIEINGMTLTGVLTLSSTTGDIDCGTVTASEFDISASTGHINLASLTTLGDIKVTSSTGEIDANIIQSGEFECENSTGGMTIAAAKAENISFSSTTGDIKISGIDAAKLELESTTGDIVGSICGSLSDYTVSADTTTGDCNLPACMTFGSRTLEADTTTGDINISFENN